MTLRSRLLLTVYCGVLVCSYVDAQSQSTTHGFKVKTIGPAKEPPSAQQMVVPYWTLEPGWNTELEMRNNMAQQKVTITPILRTANGKELPLSAVTLDPDQSLSVDLRDAVDQTHPELANSVGSYGSVVFRFKGLASANMFAAAMVRREGHPIDFHFDGDDPDPGYSPGGIEGIWWQPSETSYDYLILSNTSRQPVNAQVVLSVAGGAIHNLPLTIAPGHTERVSIRDVIPSDSSGMGGVSVTYTTGHLSVAQIVFDETTGLAAIMKLFERDLAEKPASHILRAPMMALSQPDPVLAFPENTKLIPQILMWNAGSKSLAVSPVIDWRNAAASGRLQHPVVQLSPHQSRIMSLSDLQAKGRIPSSALWSTVTLSYLGTHADLVAVALAYDQTNRYGLQTPFSEGTARLWKGSMWHVDGTHNTLITTGNGGSEPTTAQVTLFYNGAQGRYRIKKLLSPGQQLWLDIGQLIRNQVPDSDGHTMPTDTMAGSYELRDMDHQTVGLLYEGKLVIDKTFGHASYGCAACCGYNTTGMVPSTFDGPINIYSQDVFQAYDTCSNTWDDVTSAAYNWSTLSPAVATVSQTGNLHTVSVGSTSGSAFVQLQSTIVSHNCPLVTKSATQPVNVGKTLSIYLSDCFDPDPKTGYVDLTAAWDDPKNPTSCGLSGTGPALPSGGVCKPNYSGIKNCYQVYSSQNLTCTTYCPGSTRLANSTCTAFLDQFPVVTTTITNVSNCP